MSTPNQPDPPDIGHVMPAQNWDAIDHSSAQSATPSPELLLQHAEFLDGQK